jgi:hypothetical protein
MIGSIKRNLMSVNLEIKGMLARLLATEDLIVEHKKVDTACFNVHTRVLTLPMWERASNVVYDMLVAHEVSHALYTPDADFTSFKVPHQFINVVEDVRVEKLIKRRYMGLAKTFYSAYKDLQEQDFFSIADENISEMNLADKVNLYFKVGNFVEINFSDEEQKIVDELFEIETFEETLVLAKKIYEYCKGKQKEQQQIPELNSHNQQSAGSDGSLDSDSSDQTEMFNDNLDSGASDNQSNLEKTSSEDFGENDTNTTQYGGSSASPIGSEEKQEPQVKTADSLKKSIQDLINNNFQENVYVELPSLNINTVIIDNKEIHSYIEEFHRGCLEDFLNKKEQYYYNSVDDIFAQANLEYQKFKTSAQKEVNYLVKEFECRKAADSYARASTARTGVLDCARLHNYKFSEDLFKKVTTLSDGKNHGLVFVLDWSGSMSSVMLDTIKQLYNLIWFCKKVAIPFDVYAFTGEWISVNYDQNNNAIYPQPHYTKKSGIFAVDERFSLLNFLTSNVNGKQLEQQMKNLWNVAYSFRNGCQSTTPYKLHLSGTPLNESLIALHNIIPNFQKKHKLQKVQCVILTDGEASQIPYHVEIQRNISANPYIGIRRINSDSTFLRDRKLGTTYKFGNEYHQFTDTLIRNLRDKFPYVNFIGMRIMEGRDAGHFIDRYCGCYGELHNKVMNDWKKDRSFVITQSAYNKYFGLSSNSLSQDSSFEVSDDASKSQIKSAFAKSLKTKKLNKKILGQFVELIA